MGKEYRTATTSKKLRKDENEEREEKRSIMEREGLGKERWKERGMREKYCNAFQ